MQPKQFVDRLLDVGFDFYAGVPDSLLKDFCAYIEDHVKPNRHVITANEGNAVALAAGYHLATGMSAAVYMQNSGLGNAINPLMSIADKEVYRIPMLLIIGWRGEPGIRDEPQHVKQGRITRAQLELLEIPHLVVDVDSNPEVLASWVHNQLNTTSAPVALLVKKGTFSEYKSNRERSSSAFLKREEVLGEILNLSKDAAIISTTGLTSRELFELRDSRGEDQRDFLTVGGMGHTASIALGLALGQPDKSLVCIDGDGSLLMHMGALPVIGSIAPRKFIHILLNNGAHESVGGQPTVSNNTDFQSIALASGYRDYAMVKSIDDLKNAWSKLSTDNGPVMIEVKIAIGSRKNLGRPTSTTHENKLAFMDWIAR